MTRTCVICGLQEKNCEEKTLFATFPLDQYRCKLWLMAVGNEDLVNLPIEKLHTSRYVCKNHFVKRDFTKAKVRLKKRAIPKLGLTAPPLPEELFQDFPLHLAKKTKDASTKKPSDSPSNVESAAEVTNDTVLQQSDICKNDDQSSSKTVLKVTNDKGINVDEDNFKEEYLEDIIDEDDFQQLPEEADRADISSGEFSWQRASAVVPCDADDVADAECSADALMFEAEAAPQRDHTRQVEPVHEGFRCNCCLGSIVGFRYVCVQCADYDLCGACEADGAHSEHYVLRVPGPRPHSEVAGVLHTIRRALVADSILLVDGLQAEVKEEEPEELDPISCEAEASEGEGVECETVGESPPPPTLGGDAGDRQQDDGHVPCAAGQHCDPDADTDAYDASVVGDADTDGASLAQIDAPHAQINPGSSSTFTSTRQSVKRTASDRICFLDLKKNTVLMLGGKRPATQPVTLRPELLAKFRNMYDANKSRIIIEKSKPVQRIVQVSKSARVVLDRLRVVKLQTSLVKR